MKVNKSDFEYSNWESSVTLKSDEINACVTQNKDNSSLQI